jgi:hypothetical protein
MQRYCLLVVSVAALLGGSWILNGPTCAFGTEPVTPGATSELRRGAEKVKYPPGYIEEAPLPEGFPLPSELGQVVEKTYPACRTYSAEGNNAFMRCFAYLSKQRHEMTAPVILDYERNADTSEAQPAEIDFMKVGRMHFILENPSLDEPRLEGPVNVADMPGMRVLSIAFQGEMSPATLDDAERKLEAEIARRKTIVAAGPLRILGYNSPMVPKGKAYWEVQVPIKERPNNIE